MAIGLIKIGEVKIKQTRMGQEMDPYYVFSGSLDTNLYEDITSNKNWMKAGKTEYDYLFCRNQVISWTSVNGFSGLTTEEKQVAASNFAVGASDRASVFSDSDLQDHWSGFIGDSRICREDRWAKSKSYISYILPMSDSIDMGIKTTELSNNYMIYGIESLASDGTTGLFDWVDNTGSYSGGTGFSGQTYWTQEYQDNLSSILRNGFK